MIAGRPRSRRRRFNYRILILKHYASLIAYLPKLPDLIAFKKKIKTLTAPHCTWLGSRPLLYEHWNKLRLRLRLRLSLSFRSNQLAHSSLSLAPFFLSVLFASFLSCQNQVWMSSAEEEELSLIHI